MKPALSVGYVPPDLRIGAACPQCGHVNAKGIRFCGACDCTLDRAQPQGMPRSSSRSDRRPRPCWPPPVAVAPRPRERGDFLARMMPGAPTPMSQGAAPEQSIAAAAAYREGRSAAAFPAGRDSAPGMNEESGRIAPATRPGRHGQITALRKERRSEALVASGVDVDDDVLATAVDDPLSLIPREALDLQQLPRRVAKRPWQGHPAVWVMGSACAILAIVSGVAWWDGGLSSNAASEALAPRALERQSVRQAAGTLQPVASPAAPSSAQANETALGRGPTLVEPPAALLGSGTGVAAARSKETADQAPAIPTRSTPPRPERQTPVSPQHSQAPTALQVAGAVDSRVAEPARSPQPSPAEDAPTPVVATPSVDEARRTLIGPVPAGEAPLPMNAARACTDAVAALGLCDRP